jgi:hypothetical protein
LAAWGVESEVGVACQFGGLSRRNTLARVGGQKVARRWEAAAGERLRDEEEAQRRRAEDNEGLVRRLLYFSNVNIADRFWHENQIASMRQLLEAQPPELRGFEWNCLWRFAHADLFALNTEFL